MTKNTKQVVLWTLAAMFLAAMAWTVRDVWLSRGRQIDCGADGIHQTIDLRDFTTRYWTYTIQLEATVKGDMNISAKLTPQKLQDLSEALQTAREFRAYVIAGYNSCATTKAQYADLGVRFQALDGLAHEINSLASNPALTQEEKAKLGALIDEYRESANGLATNKST